MKAVTSFLLAMLLLTLVSCAFEREPDVWYLVTNERAYLCALPVKSSVLLVAAVHLETLALYRTDLQHRGIVSDDLGALQDLFGLRGQHYMRGTSDAWNALFSILDQMSQNPQNPQQRWNTLVANAKTLSKSLDVDTLQRLAGPRTDSEDIQEALRLLAKRVAQVRYFDASLFIDPKADSARMKMHMSAWTDAAVKAVMNIGTEE